MGIVSTVFSQADICRRSREQPSYFKKEDLQSQEMSFAELSHYIIGDLKQSGFDTHAAAGAADEAR